MNSSRSTRQAASGAVGLVGSFAWSSFSYCASMLLLAVIVPTLLLQWAPTVIVSGSMGPRINRGDVVLIGDPGDEPIRAGRIITFEEEGVEAGAITHRVTGRDEQGRYLTRGDANPVADGVPIEPERVLGVGRMVVPLVGLPVVWFREGNLLPLAITLVFLLVLLSSAILTKSSSPLLRHPGVFSLPFPSAAETPAPKPVRKARAERAPPPPRQPKPPRERTPRRPAKQAPAFSVAAPGAGGWASWGNSQVVAAAGVGGQVRRGSSWVVLWSLALGVLAPIVTMTGVAHAAFNDTTASANNTLEAADSFGFSHDQLVGRKACGGASSVITVVEPGVDEDSTIIVRVVIRQGLDLGAISAIDSRGNSYQLDANAVRTGQVRSAILSAHVNTALEAGDTITVTHPDGVAESVVIEQFSGILATDGVDGVAATNGNTATPSASVIPVTDPALIVGTVGTHADASYAEHSGWTSLSAHTTSTCGVVDNHAAYRIVDPGSVSYAPSLSGADDWAEALVAYRFEVDTQPPAAPVLSGTAGDQQTSLSWTTVTDPSAPVSYRLSRDGVAIYEGTNTTFTDTGRSNGASYAYTVTAADSEGNRSLLSNSVTLVPTPVAFVREFGQVACAVGGTSLVTVPVGGVAAGNTLLVRVVLRQPASDVAAVAVSDGFNTYGTADADIAEPGDVRTVVFSAAVTQSLSAGATITVTHPLSSAVMVVVDEFTGLAADGAVEAVDTRFGSDAAGLSSSVTSVSALGLVYGAVGVKDVVGYTEDAAGWQGLTTATGNPCYANLPMNRGAYRILAGTGSFTHNPTLGANKQWARALLVYRSDEDVSPPPVPTLSGTPGNEQTTLNWNAVIDPSTPVSYQLFRDGTQVYSGTATTYTDTGLTNGDTYGYVVRARDALGFTSANSNTVTLRPTPIGWVQSVGSLTCGGTSSIVTIGGSGVSQGNTVVVRVALRKGNETGVVSASDSRGNTYTLDVNSLNGGQVRTAILSAYVATALQPGDTITVVHPDTEAEAVAVDEFRGITASGRLDATGTAASSGAVTAVSVSATSTTVDTLLLTSVANKDHIAGAYTQPSGWTGLSAQAATGCNSAADLQGGYRTAVAASNYTYAATLGAAKEWAAAFVVYRSVVDGTAPSAPVLSGSPGNTQVTLNWTTVTDPSPPVTYQLYRGATLIYDGTATTFTDTGLSNGVSISYTVKASDALNNQSVASNTVTTAPSSVEHQGSVGTASCVGAGSSGSVVSTITVPAGGVALGRTLVVGVFVRKGNPEGGTISATDDRGNIYTLDVSSLFAGHTRVAYLSARVDTALLPGDRILVTHSAGEATAVRVNAFTGIASTSRVDSTGTGSANTTTPTATANTVQSTTVLIGGLSIEGNPDSYTDAAGWTNQASQQVTCAGKELGVYAARRNVATAASYSYAPVLGTARNHAEVVVAYRSENDITAPAAPVLSGTPADGQNNVSWTTVTDPSSPVVYRLSRDGFLIYQGTATSYADTGRTNGTAHSYVVRAVDAAGNESPDSTALVLRASPISFVQQLGTVTCAGTSSVVTVPAGGVEAGHTLVIRVALKAPSPESGEVSVTDSQGNTYTVDADAVRPGKDRMIVVSGYISNQLVSGNTITVTHPNGAAEAVVIDEFTGMRALSRLHTYGTGNGNTAAPSASLSTTNTGAMLYGAVATRATRSHVAPGSPWAGLAGYTSADCGGGNITDANAAYRLLSTAGTWTYNPTLSGADEWAALVVAYLPIIGNDQNPPGAPEMGGGGGGGFASAAAEIGSSAADGTAELTWSVVYDPSSPVSYQLLRDGEEVVVTLATEYTDEGLEDGQIYTYVVRATDAAGNQSSDSNELQLTPGPDTEPPPAPVLVGVAGDGQVELSWTPVDDMSGPVLYELLRNGLVIARSPATTYTDTDVSNDFTYTYVVRAIDAADNVSLDSNAVVASPVAATEALPTDEPTEEPTTEPDPEDLPIELDPMETEVPLGVPTSDPAGVLGEQAPIPVDALPPADQPALPTEEPALPTEEPAATPEPIATQTPAPEEPSEPAPAEPAPTPSASATPTPEPSETGSPEDAPTTPATATPEAVVPPAGAQVEVVPSGRRRPQGNRQP